MDVLTASRGTGATPDIAVRRVREEDAETFLHLVASLAAYEKLPPPDAAARRRLLRDGFASPPRFEAYMAECGGTAAGYAIVFESYSSFLALPTLFLEDLFVLPEFRKRRVGRTLFRAMAALARERGCGRMEWTVLDWNEPAHHFYRSLGAKRMRQWELYRMTKDELNTAI